MYTCIYVYLYKHRDISPLLPGVGISSVVASVSESTADELRFLQPTKGVVAERTALAKVATGCRSSSDLASACHAGCLILESPWGQKDFIFQSSLRGRRVISMLETASATASSEPHFTSHLAVLSCFKRDGLREAPFRNLVY